MGPRSVGCFVTSVISPFQHTAPAEARPPFTTHSPKMTGSVFEVTVRWHVVGWPSTGPHAGLPAKSPPATQSWPTVAGLNFGSPAVAVHSPSEKFECGRKVLG